MILGVTKMDKRSLNFDRFPFMNITNFEYLQERLLFGRLIQAIVTVQTLDLH